MPRGYVLALFLLAIAYSVSGQQLNSLVRKKIPCCPDTLILDTLSTAPGSVKILHKGELLDSTAFTVDFVNSRIIFHRSLTDSITITYRRLPVALARSFYNKDIRLMETPEGSRVNPFTFVPSLKTEDPFKTKGLNKNGSISRGISFGNNQDVVVNSNLNLQLSGNLTEEIEILAAVTDNNIPFQAEGNTQQLQEFDKVFIQLSKGRSKLIAGDFVLTRPPGYFLNYLKKSQGGSFSSFLTPEKNKTQHFVSVSAGVSKGKFARNRIQGIEGNQGPYKLRGAENELFIIILSGTERVYIDGVLMKRGQEFDYTIDYNTSEIRFTARQLITKDKRIIVEFDYSERSYGRSLIQATDHFRTEKLNVIVNVFSEQDNKNKPLLQELQPVEKQLLRNIGDSLNQALTLNIDTVEFNGTDVLYRQTDTLVNGFIFPGVFIYSTDPERARYRLGFSDVGQGRGNYRQISSAANGKVFEWIAPVNGIKQGSFEPVTLLITPKRKQMATTAVEYAITNSLKAGIEGAVSNNDLNTFSNLNASDDIGNAVKVFAEKLARIDSVRSVSFFTAYERVDKRFSPFDRFRPVEFEREWNLPVASFIRETQHLSTAQIAYKGDHSNSAFYRLNSFIEDNGFYRGFRNSAGANLNNRLFSFTGEGSYLNSESALSNTDYLKGRGVLSKIVGPLRIGAGNYFERDKFFDPVSDTLLRNSFQFNEFSAFINDPDSSEKRFELSYLNRVDHLPFRNSFHLATKADNFNGMAEVFRNDNGSLRTSATYRKLRVIDTLLAARQPEETVLGRVDLNQRLWKGIVTTSLFYEAGSGLESRRQYSYLEVAPGLGYYTWIDYNSNGIKELDEFEIAVYRDQAKFIRILIPTIDYVKVFNNTFSGTVGFTFSSWNDKKGILKLLSFFSGQTAYRIDKKTNSEEASDVFNPLSNTENDPLLVSLLSSFRTVSYFNRSGSVFSMDHTYQDNRNRSLLVNGFETRKNALHNFHFRLAFTKSLAVENEAIRSERVSSAAFFANRDFQIESRELLPKIVYQPGTTFRLSLLYRYAEKFNRSGEEKAFVNKAGAEFRYNVAAKGSISASVNAIDFKYSSDTNTPVAFEMLESLKPGRNYTWNLSWQRNLSQNMQLSILYDGRKSPAVNTIHIGSVQVRAFF